MPILADYLVLLSNVFVVPAAVEAYRQRAWVLAAWLVTTGALSVFYHACEQEFVCAGSPKATLKIMDVAFANMLVPLSAITLMDPDRTRDLDRCVCAHLLVLGGILSLYVQLEAPLDGASMAPVAILYITALAARWGLLRRFPPWDPVWGGGMVLLTLGGVYFLWFSSNGTAAHTGDIYLRYRYMHAGWHLTIMLALYCMLRMRAVGAARAARNASVPDEEKPAYDGLCLQETGSGGSDRESASDRGSEV